MTATPTTPEEKAAIANQTGGNAGNTVYDPRTPSRAPASSGAYSNAGDEARYSNPSVPVRTAPAARVNPESFADFETNRSLGAKEIADTSDVYTKELASTMDLINAEYAKRTADQTTENTKQTARTRVLNSSTGNLDSGTGITALGTTEKKGSDALTAIETEKNAKIQAAIGSIDQLKFNAIQAATAAKGKEADSYNAERLAQADKDQKSLEDNLKVIASSGQSLDSLKTDKSDPNNPDEPTTYDHLIQSGWTPETLKAYFLTNAPKDALVSNTPQIVGNQATFFTKQADGTIAQQTLTLPNTNKQVKTVTRVPGEATYVFYTDGTHEALGTGGPTSSNKSSAAKTIKDGGLTTSQDEIGQLNDALLHGAKIGDTTYAPTGNDGYVDPGLYKALYDKWKGGGGTTQGFVKYFPPAKYVNPAALGLPAYLQNKTKAPKKTTGA